MARVEMTKQIPSSPARSFMCSSCVMCICSYYDPPTMLMPAAISKSRTKLGYHSKGSVMSRAMKFRRHLTITPLVCVFTQKFYRWLLTVSSGFVSARGTSPLLNTAFCSDISPSRWEPLGCPVVYFDLGISVYLSLTQPVVRQMYLLRLCSRAPEPLYMSESLCVHVDGLVDLLYLLLMWLWGGAIVLITWPAGILVHYLRTNRS